MNLPRNGGRARSAGRRIVITRRAPLDIRDGINIFIFALSDALLDAGHEVTILATEVGDPARLRSMYAMRHEPALLGVERGRARFGLEGLTPGWLTRGRRILRDLDPDLIINNGALPFRPRGLTANLAHDLGWATAPRRLDRVRNWYKRYAYGHGDAVIALCPEVGAGLADELGMAVSDVRVIPPCADTVAGAAASAERREDAILHTGTGAYKDPGATVRAFAALHRPTTRLYIEGETTSELDAQLANLPAATRSRVELVGELPGVELRRLLGRVRVAAFPTKYSVPTASATVVEAIAAGTPIAGSVHLSSLVLRHEGNGLACRDDAALTAAFDRLLADEPGWHGMAATARAMAPHFHAEAVARAYLEMLDGRMP